MIELKGFSFKYSDFIFFNVNFEINLHHITLLTGSNGSGKSTLFRVLSGLNKNYEGSVTLRKNEIKYLSFKKISSEIIHIKQEPILNIIAPTPYDDLSIWINKFETKNDNSAKIKKALEFMELDEFAHVPVWKLSGGQLKRVGLSALMLFPKKYWLIDEPENGLDNRLIEKLKTIMVNRRKNGLGTLIATHRIDLYKEIADEIIMIKNRGLEL